MNRIWSPTRLAAIAALAAGLFIATAVIGYFNFGAVLAALRPIGVPGFMVVVLAQLAMALPLGLAWWTVAPRQPLRRLGAFIWSSLAAEAAANILPFSQLGGAAVASRVAVLGGVPTSVALGSNMVDITVELAAQLVWTVTGVALLARHLHSRLVTGSLLPASLWGVAFAACLLLGLLAAQRWGLSAIERLVRRLAPGRSETGAVTRVVRALYRRPHRLAIAFALHLTAWFATALGAWLILDFIGRPLPLTSVFAMESLLFAVRNVAFFIPGGLGVQEGAYALLGPVFGLPAEAALALSLLKRARDIAIGVPVLLIWQAVEIRHPLRQMRPAPATGSPSA
jgi:putative membrane protein